MLLDIICRDLTRIFFYILFQLKFDFMHLSLGMCIQDGLQTVVLCIQRTMKLHQFLLSKSRFVIYLPEPFYYSCHWQSLLWLQPNTLIKYWNSTTRMQWLDYLQLSIKLEKFEFTKLSRQCCKWTNRLYWIKREEFVWWNSTNRVSGKNNLWIL